MATRPSIMERLGYSENGEPELTEEALARLTNTQQLRRHLPANGLAAALLTAWEGNDLPNAQARLEAALKDFFTPKVEDNAAISDPS